MKLMNQNIKENLAIVPNTCLVESLSILILSDSVLRVDIEYKVPGQNTPPSWGYAHFYINH